MREPSVTAIAPLRAVEGGRIAIHGSGFPVDDFSADYRSAASRRASRLPRARRLVLLVPGDLEGGRTPIRLGSDARRDGVRRPSARRGRPVFTRSTTRCSIAQGNLFVTYSGSRGQEAPVSIFRVTPGGTREPFASGIVNATSMAFGPDGQLYVSSRFEGAVYRVADDGSHEQVASDLGVACGLAFDADGCAVRRRSIGHDLPRATTGSATAFATLPPSVAAFHLAMSPWGELFVTAPTLGSYDHVYRIDRDGEVRTLPTPLRPAAGAGVRARRHAARRRRARRRERPVSVRRSRWRARSSSSSGGALVGVAFGPGGELVVDVERNRVPFRELTIDVVI